MNGADTGDECILVEQSCTGSSDVGHLRFLASEMPLIAMWLQGSYTNGEWPPVRQFRGGTLLFMDPNPTPELSIVQFPTSQLTRHFEPPNERPIGCLHLFEEDLRPVVDWLFQASSERGLITDWSPNIPSGQSASEGDDTRFPAALSVGFLDDPFEYHVQPGETRTEESESAISSEQKLLVLAEDLRSQVVALAAIRDEFAPVYAHYLPPKSLRAIARILGLARKPDPDRFVAELESMRERAWAINERAKLCWEELAQSKASDFYKRWCEAIYHQVYWDSVTIIAFAGFVTAKRAGRRQQWHDCLSGSIDANNRSHQNLELLRTFEAQQIEMPSVLTDQPDSVSR